MMRRYPTLVAAFALILFASASGADDAMPLGGDICAMRPDLCGGAPLPKKQVHKAAPAYKAPAAQASAPTARKPAALPVARKPLQRVVERAPASRPIRPMTFDDYMTFNAQNPAVHPRIPDHQSAFVDARTSYFGDVPVQQDATLNATAGANPASFNPPPSQGSFNAGTSSGFGNSGYTPAGGSISTPTQVPVTEGLGGGGAPASAAPASAPGGSGDSTPIR